jgi:hypothetical protein
MKFKNLTRQSYTPLVTLSACLSVSEVALVLNLTVEANLSKTAKGPWNGSFLINPTGKPGTSSKFCARGVDF